MVDIDELTRACAQKLDVLNAELVVSRSRKINDSSSTMLAVVPALSFTAFAFVLTLFIFIVIALYKRRIPSRKYIVILSRTLGDIFTSVLVGSCALFASTRSAPSALIALFLFISTYSTLHLSLSHIFVCILRYVSITRPYGFQSICTIRRICIHVGIGWIAAIFYGAAYAPLMTVIISPEKQDVCSFGGCQRPLLAVCISVICFFVPLVVLIYLAVMYKLRQISISERMHNEPEITKKKLMKFLAYGGHIALFAFICTLVAIGAGFILGQGDDYNAVRELMTRDCDVVQYIDVVNRLELLAGGAILIWCVRIVFDVIILLLVEYKRLLPWMNNNLEPLRDNQIASRSHTLQFQKGCLNCPVFNIDAQFHPWDFKN